MHDKDICPRNEQWQKHGYWKEHYENGLLAEEGLFVNDKEEGVFILYSLEGKLQYKKTYINGKCTGPAEIYHSKLIWRGYYDDNNIVGFWEKYDNEKLEYAEFFAQ